MPVIFSLSSPFLPFVPSLVIKFEGSLGISFPESSQAEANNVFSLIFTTQTFHLRPLLQGKASNRQGLVKHFQLRYSPFSWKLELKS